MANNRVELAVTFAKFIPQMVRGAHLDFFAERNVTWSQMLVLMSCFAHGRSPMSALARDMHVSLPTMTGFIDRLVDSGHVRRLSCETDRRQVLVEVTAKGRQFVMDHRQVVANRFMVVSQSLSEKDVDDMLRVLAKLIGQFDPEGGK